MDGQVSSDLPIIRVVSPASDLLSATGKILPTLINGMALSENLGLHYITSHSKPV